MNRNLATATIQQRSNGAEWIGGEPSVLVFDVNETLIDFESMNPLFEKIFGDKRVMREWLGHLIMYSMTITLSGLYEGYFTLGQGLLKMVGDIHGVRVSDDDIEEIRQAMLTMPAHPDVQEGLSRLKDAGFRLVTLTNSPSNPGGQSPLEHAGLAHFFERQFTIETVRAYKPAQLVYHMVAQELDVPPSSCFMVAAHVWDTVGAQSAGYTAGLITRPGNAPLPVHSLPQPNLVVPDLPALATELARVWRRS
ncbi:haloacid dehalogenase type II [Streptosporangium sp. 'caverna']|uniref:haloacid dehalogenase type II n=1 Tax=Streptosporangium sp. 'caverna' TaxID=2202249 RepID=UPI000D7E3055|nr:haloacid dehalogenase type II [Streptosporangium sp. 'caverna']AWS43914.1 haloacid dehalogenase type II [Streptosporangium sp. 'caverna']